jgi:hypothetical protein
MAIVSRKRGEKQRLYQQKSRTYSYAFIMVELDKIRSSNQKLATTLPSDLVAVFVGATNGIGEHTIKAFVKYTVKPRV